MVVQHTVVFRLRHAPDSFAERAFLDEALRVLPDVPGVQGFTVQRQVSIKSDLRWQFAMTFATQEAYDAYDAHPDHRAFVAERWVPEVEAFQEYDFIAEQQP